MTKDVDEAGTIGEQVVVMGGCGFIGRHLVRHLAQDVEVVVIDDLSGCPTPCALEEAPVLEADVRRLPDLDGAPADPDAVFHLAAITDVGESFDRPVATHEVNVDGTLAALEYARACDARFVFASSAAVYGQPEAVPVPEDASTAPTSPYGLSKLQAEALVRMHADLYGLSGAILRYFNVYGPRPPQAGPGGVIDRFVRRAVEGEPLLVHGEGSQTRDFVHVDDVVRATMLAAGRTGRDRIDTYNVGTGSSVSILELAGLVAEVNGADSEVRHDDPRPGDIERSRADVTRLKRDLGFEPTRSLRDGVRELIEARGDSV